MSAKPLPNAKPAANDYDGAWKVIESPKKLQALLRAAITSPTLEFFAKEL